MSRCIQYPVITLIGPTGIGKTALTLEICKEFNGEVISMDSMQVYRFMDIGTAKPTVEERQQVPHHLIDIADPDEQYNAARFVHDCLAAIEAVGKRGKISLVSGGTGMYLSSLLNGLFDNIQVSPEIRRRLAQEIEAKGNNALHARLQAIDPVTAQRVHVNDRQRILRALEIYETTGQPWSEKLQQTQRPCTLQRLLQLGLHCDREEMYERINRRTGQMMKQGLLEEVRALINRGYACSLPSMGAIGYRHMCQALQQHCSLADAVALLQRDTRRYGKRQMTWFRHQLKKTCWTHRSDRDGVMKKINNFLKSK
ncbi:MAG: tRNA (adenosine(37)-N6)-dimethylallyltransferase MiaA [Desulfobulbus propionicus]|nr:MAG: tRNA (adenosine(37)-N6)-dimethylallyltransferase MiaA [Desulfobulbus propionicus]